jgi:hypothetical protein
MKFIHIKLDQDILNAALKTINERCIMVFPTRVSANLARLRFEPNWHFEEVIFTTMEDFKASLLATDLPQLEDEKRLLCLYQVLSQEDKEYFHLLDYGDLVDWGNHFFQFLQEFSEAGRDVNDLAALLEAPELYLRHWQEEHIKRISDILQRYRGRIGEMGFEDRIFHPPLTQLHIPYQDYRIVLVNQYYYSKLEQDLLLCLEHQQNEIWLLYHNLDVDENCWPKADFDPAQAYQELNAKPEIEIFHCENEEQHALWLLGNLDDSRQGTIIDNQFWQKDYSVWFPENLINRIEQLPLTRTCWYEYLSLVDELVQSQQQTPGFLPLGILIRYLRDPRFPALLLPDWDSLWQDQLLREIFALSDQELLYLDLEPQAQFNPHTDPKAKYQLLPQIVAKLSSVITQIQDLRSTKDLLRLFEEQLDPQSICSADELSKTDILAQIWTAMANFCAAEELGVVTDWELIFPNVGAGLFRLWLDFVKPIRLRYQSQKPASGSWEISNLLDARNRHFEHLAILQMVEGTLPQAPGAVWLLNEAQRAKLGLLTYETIRAWERYYFFRLVFCARSVSLYSYRNGEKGIEPSSLIGELQQIIDTEQPQPTLPTISFRQVFQSWQELSANELHQQIQEAVIFQDTADSSFWRLPVDASQDFGQNHQITQSSYDLSLLINNPFAWYIRVKSKLKARKAELVESISPSLFGILMHAYFAEVLGESPSRHPNPDSLAAIFEDEDRLRLTLQQIIQSRDFYYKIPKNYNQDFLEAIISECLADSLREFYRRFLRHHLAQTSFTLIPEQRTMSREEQDYKELCRVKQDSQQYQVLIRGRADLRIETPDALYIVDFKTGSAHEEQLIFYEWFYYLIQDPSLQAKLHSYFWQILDMRIDSKHRVSDQKRERYFFAISESLSRCLQEGFHIAQKSKYKGILKEITRSDIYLEGAQHD